jgi:multidrug resistance efflux pump
MSGIVEGTEVNLASKVSGKISDICCREGDSVREGQLAIRLESEDLRASVEQAAAGVESAKAEIRVSEASIENAGANVRSAEADIKSVEADIEKARVRMEELRKEMERADTLYKKGFVSRESYDQAVSAYDTSVAEYRSQQSRLEAAFSRRDALAAQLKTALSQLNASRSSLKEAEANLSFHRSRLGDAAIISPVSGLVIFKSLEKGETVSPGVTIMTVVDMSSLYVRANVEETKIGMISLNSEAVVKVEGISDKVFRGRVSEIGRYAEFATQRDVVRGRQDIKTFRVKIRVDDSGGVLKPGMTVFVEIPKKI